MCFQLVIIYFPIIIYSKTTRYKAKVLRAKSRVQGTWGDSSAGKSAYSTCVKTWVQIASTHIKSQVWWYFTTLAVWEEEIEGSLALASHQPNSRSSETLSQENKVEATEQDTQNVPFCLFSAHVCISIWTLYTLHTHIHHTQKEQRERKNKKSGVGFPLHLELTVQRLNKL